MSLQCLINTLIGLFNQIDPVVPTILMGDFNVDLNEHPTHLIVFMSNNGYDQLMDSPTTDRGTSIVHIYCNSNHGNIVTDIADCYYSDHDTFVYYSYVNTLCGSSHI